MESIQLRALRTSPCRGWPLIPRIRPRSTRARGRATVARRRCRLPATRASRDHLRYTGERSIGGRDLGHNRGEPPAGDHRCDVRLHRRPVYGGFGHPDHRREPAPSAGVVHIQAIVGTCASAMGEGDAFDYGGCSGITVEPAVLPEAGIHTYSQTLLADGGIAPYSFPVASGTLPAGLSLSSGGSSPVRPPRCLTTTSG